MTETEKFLEEFRKTREFKVILPVLKSDENLRVALFNEIKSIQYPFPEYSSWIAIHYFNAFPEDFTSEWIETCIETILKTSNHTVQRNLISSIGQAPIKISERGDVLDRLIHFIMDPEALPALKLHSIRAVEFHFIPTYPELIRELKSIFELLENDPKKSIQMMCRAFHKKYKNHEQYNNN